MATPPAIRRLSDADAARSVCDLWADGLRHNPGGVTADMMADVMHCQRSMVYRYGDADGCETMQRIINGVVSMARDGRDWRIIQRMADRLGARVVPVSAVAESPASLMAHGAEVMRETADVTATLAHVIDDGRVTSEEADAMGREVDEAIVKLEQLRAAIRATARGDRVIDTFAAEGA